MMNSDIAERKKLKGTDKPVWFSTPKDIAELSKIRLKTKLVKLCGLSTTYAEDTYLSRDEFVHKMEHIANIIPSIWYQFPGLDFALDDNLVLDVVMNRTYEGRNTVYDIEVEKEHNFIAEGNVVHNCKHLVRVLNRILDKGM